MTENKLNSPISLWGKIQKMLREVLIIVFGVTVSIWFANWNDKRKELAEVKEFLADIKQDLTQDTAYIRLRIDRIKPYIKDYDYALSLTSQQLDSLKRVKTNVNLKFDLTPTQLNEGNYQGFKSSGKIGFIDDKNLKKKILEYYEQVIPSLKDIEKEHLDRQKVLMTTFLSSEYSEKSTKETFLNPSVKAELNNAKLFGNIVIQFSEMSVKQADTLLLQINKVLK